MNWTIKQISKESYECRFRIRNVRDACSILLMSDEHWDNKHCDRRVLKEHHEEAVKKGAPIFKFGDTLCLMQGRWDKRKSESELRPEHRGSDYLNKVKNTAVDWYKPYSANIALVTRGNHEESIIFKHDYDILQELTKELGCHYGNYRGFVRFVFEIPNRGVTSFTLCWHHGYGGGGEITRGMIDNSRTRGQYLADVYYSGHIHRKNFDENVVLALDGSLEVIEKQQLFLRGSCYKREDSYYHIANGRAARPLGGWWLNVEFRRPGKSGVKCQLIPVPTA